MKNIICLVFACLVAGCVNQTVPDYTVVPSNVPDEAKPVWVLRDAAHKSDLARLLSVCTAEKRAELKTAEPSELFNEVNSLLPPAGIGSINLRVSRSLNDVCLTLRLPSSGKNLVTRPGFAWVIIEERIGFPVVRRDGVWLIAENLKNDKAYWVEQE